MRTSTLSGSEALARAHGPHSTLHVTDEQHEREKTKVLAFRFPHLWGPALLLAGCMHAQFLLRL